MMASQWSSQQEVAEYRDLQANAMAVDCAGQLVMLAGRRSIGIVNLNKMSEMKKIPRHSKWEIIAAQWNPHPSHAHLFVTACNQRADIFGWEDGHGGSTQQGSLKAHTRVISDVDWSPVDPQNVATCSGDAFTFVWDIRDCRKPATSLQAVAGASQVKWNKFNSYQLATAHDGDIRIWDQRKGTSPVQYIAAHLSKIHGLDWSPGSEVHLATSSQDCMVKFWDVNNPKQPEGKLVSGSPIWRARYTPFGEGLVTVMVPQLRRGENSLFLWHLNELHKPVHTFVGHTDVILEFQWRKPSDECPDYQLVTWSKDQSLRIWRIEKHLQQLCGEDQDCGIMITADAGSDTEMQGNVASSIPVDIPKAASEGTNGVTSGSEGTDAHSQGTNGHIIDGTPTRECTRREDTFSSAQQPRTLYQEFNLVNFQIPNVNLEEMDPIKRVCTVSAVSGNHIVKLSMLFPQMYPNNAAPSFQFGKGTTIDKIAQSKLVKALQDTSLQHVKHNRSCVEPCLRQLVTSLDSLTHDARQSPNPDPEFPLGQHAGSISMPTPNFLPIYSFGAIQDASIPFPRTCGARFSGQGSLVCFTRRTDTSSHMRRTSSTSELTPRAMSSMSTFSQTSRTPQGGAPRRPFFITCSPPSSDSLTSFHYKDRKVRSRSKSRVRESHLESRSQESKRSKIAPVIVYNTACLLPVNRQLAQTYVMDTDDVRAMCMKNAASAAAVGRKDLVQMWSLASLVSSPKLKADPSPDKGTPWAAHPFGRSLISSLLSHYTLQYDVQSVAMLCCVFGSRLSIPRPVGGSSLSRGTSQDAPSYTYKSSGNPNIELVIATALNLSHNNQVISSSLSPSVAKIKRSNSWSQLADVDYQFMEPKDPAEQEREEHESSSRILDSSKSAQYDQFKVAYAELLYRWGLLDKRAEVLKYVTSTDDTIKNIDFNAHLDCIQCHTVMRGIQCSNCQHSVLQQCSICHLTVKGSSSYCLVCGHGGHAKHMLDWFRNHKMCPTGCGCSCVDGCTEALEE